ncbi:putative serine protease K12H4.7 [Bacillus rossius redtenbacheri]|uniref:putative serine protease K12H4.7 n=1 Tax=Bacillus rossius redtenbacheri TaxID=93214 RepID=UPI002FDEA7C5
MHFSQLMAVVHLLVLLTNQAKSWKIFQKGRSKLGMLGSPAVNISGVELPPSEWFEQKLDHFNPTKTTTWKQKYYTNSTFYKVGGPVFLLIGGEGAANATWMVQGSWLDYAAEHNALCFQLEHRFYGDSHPTKDTSVKNLAYLSSEQALADAANFIAGMTEKHKLPRGTKWVAFGGSYPGSLAAWLRLKYPHLVHAAVSTSGPLLALADFGDYFGVVKASLSTTGEGCVEAIQNATRQIDLLLRDMVGLNTMKSLFRLCNDVDPDNANDIANLYVTLADNFAGVVQYNKDNRAFEGAKAANVTIDVVCGVMTDASVGPAVRRYARVSNMLLDAYGEKCFDFSYARMLASMRNTSWGSGGARQWTYQTCTEFGFFQTSSQKEQVFGDKFPVEFYIQQCSDIFGRRFDAELLSAGIERTNLMYGALSVDVSNVVFVHGSIDPWHALGITRNTSSAPAIFIEGTAHCANMYPSLPTDPPQLTAARSEIGRLIRQWLDDDLFDPVITPV